jgi:hypothetical protein
VSLRRAALVLPIAVLVACGFDAVGELGATPGVDAAGDGSAPPGNADGAAGDGGPTTTPVGSLDGGDDAPADAPLDVKDAEVTPATGIVYGHSVTTLYRFEPVGKTFATVGPLTGCVNLSDIAVDRDGKIFGVGNALYRVDPATGACTIVANQPQPFTATFVAAGTVDPVNEALVAYLNADYVRVDRVTGSVTLITANALGAYLPSGDLVSVAGSGTYVSVTGPSCGDCLLSVNPATGVIVKNLGSIGQAQIFGLGLWAGTVYGFAGGGETYAITIGASSVTSVLVPNANKPAGGFIGGGSTTAAPN